jgi:hypothetical protein
MSSMNPKTLGEHALGGQTSLGSTAICPPQHNLQALKGMPSVRCTPLGAASPRYIFSGRSSAHSLGYSFREIEGREEKRGEIESGDSLFLLAGLPHVASEGGVLIRRLPNSLCLRGKNPW